MRLSLVTDAGALMLLAGLVGVFGVIGLIGILGIVVVGELGVV